MAASLSRLMLFLGGCLCVLAPGTGALQFLNPEPIILQGFLDMNTDIDCSTDNPNATVTLLHSPNFFSWVERPLSPNKLVLNGQVFTLLKLKVNDAGRYNCKATNGQQTIRWQRWKGIMIISSGSLPKHFLLIPDKPIVMLQGGNVQITCEAEGAKVSKLHWKKKTDSGYVNVPDSMVTNEIDKDSNFVRAILKITKVQPEDGGDYKCVLTAYNKQDHRLTTIRVDEPKPPIIYPIDGPRTVKEGTEKVIKCVARASPKPIVHWYKNGEMLNITHSAGPSDKSCKDLIYEVYEENPGSALHSTITVQVLKIRSTLYSRDQGEFGCRATNGVEPPAELAFDLDVQSAPVLDKSPRRRVYTWHGRPTNPTNILCVLRKGVSPAPTFSWSYKLCWGSCKDWKSCKVSHKCFGWDPVKQRPNIFQVKSNVSESTLAITSKSLPPKLFFRCIAENVKGKDEMVAGLFEV